jgi:protein gp37
MSDGSSIEWMDATWNPVRGCTKISPGCDCYAEKRIRAAVEAGAKRLLIASENKRDSAELGDAIVTAIQCQFYDSPTKSILAVGKG